MNNNKWFMGLVYGTILLAFIAGFTVGKSYKCDRGQVAEVYMIGNVQEDDLFIPASSIGKVDLKR